MTKTLKIIYQSQTRLTYSENITRNCLKFCPEIFSTNDKAII